jgi:hypothetical protein
VNSANLDTMLVTSVLAVLLGLEWRYHRRRLRVGAALVALVVLGLYQPNYTGARRRALAATPAERVTLIPVAGSETQPLSEYQSGVYMTMRAVADAAVFGEGARLAAVGALFWLACAPALRQAYGSADEVNARPDPVAPEA